jgi:hypothetical protein
LSRQKQYYRALLDYFEARKQATLAECLGTDQSTISRLKRGIYLRRDTVTGMAEAGRVLKSPFLMACRHVPEPEDMEWDRNLDEEEFKRWEADKENYLPRVPGFINNAGEGGENRTLPSSDKETLVGGITERNIIPVRLIASGPRGENLETAPRVFNLLVMAAHWLPLIEGERYPSFRWDAARVRPGNVILSKDGEEYRASVYSLDTDTGEFSEETTFVVIDQPLPEG